MTVELELILKKYMAKFFEVHSYKPAFVPHDLTVEWLEDQLKALEWYGKYQAAVQQAKAQAQPIPQHKVSKRRTAKSNPFKA
jgi:hypothetical protein